MKSVVKTLAPQNCLVKNGIKLAIAGPRAIGPRDTASDVLLDLVILGRTVVREQVTVHIRIGPQVPSEIKCGIQRLRG